MASVFDEDDDYDTGEDTMRMAPIRVPAYSQFDDSAEQTGQMNPIGDTMTLDSLSDDEESIPADDEGASNEQDAQHNPAVVKTPDPHHKKSIAIIASSIAAGLLVIAGVGYGVYAYWSNKQHQQAVQTCESSVRNLETAVTSYKKEQQNAQQYMNLATTDVTDGALITNLHHDVSVSIPQAKTCSTTATTQELHSTATAMKGQAESLNNATDNLKADIAGIKKSQDSKEIERAKQTLTEEIATAQKLYTSSEGTVANDSVRYSLNSAISQAQQMLNNSNSSVTAQQFTTQIQALKTAEKAVTDSQAEKLAADLKAAEEKARKEAEEKARQEAEEQAQQGNDDDAEGGDNSNNSSNSSSSSNNSANNNAANQAASRGNSRVGNNNNTTPVQQPR
ncbi:hypothetical protein [Aeriscardovia aeriphila]|uniref:Sugar-binding protein n=1 Tax=Aeriscardovia aeriphila TaxID=218139 RepID=A0A261FBM1_9BIFI|nr:hypothetical protein [Aeriscardovia aeriphila]NYI25348.1 chemotaxis protein histidine kinase CheA [Aeriscardovia aeriphila]OZG56498.1 sugar-binding protein [Aeriscardovia aeriphila]